MSKLKTTFKFSGGCEIKIVGGKPHGKPYVLVSISEVGVGYLEGKDLEKFAINLLKQLNYKTIKK